MKDRGREGGAKRKELKKGWNVLGRSEEGRRRCKEGVGGVRGNGWGRREAMGYKTTSSDGDKCRARRGTFFVLCPTLPPPSPTHSFLLSFFFSLSLFLSRFLPPKKIPVAPFFSLKLWCKFTITFIFPFCYFYFFIDIS